MWSKIFKASNHGLVRGVAIYSITWPVSSIIQQSLEPGNKDIDWQQAAKFSMYGGLYVAPTLFAWMKFASYIWPSMTITSHITKVRNENKIIIKFRFKTELRTFRYLPIYLFF